jgi:hypothetical protein
MSAACKYLGQFLQPHCMLQLSIFALHRASQESASCQESWQDTFYGSLHTGHEDKNILVLLIHVATCQQYQVSCCRGLMDWENIIVSPAKENSKQCQHEKDKNNKQC